MLLPLLPLFALFLLLSTGCAVREDISYPVYGSVSAPANDVQVAVKSANYVQHSNVVTAARSTIGTPYRFGGSSPATGFDCSGLVCWSYGQLGVRVPRRAQDQLYAGSKVLSRSELQAGDIVVFKGTNNRTGWHSGIYTGNGKFVHSPRSGKNVTESSIDEAYYVRHFAGGSRVVADSGGLMTAAYTPASRILKQPAQARTAERKEASFTTAAGPAPKNTAKADSKKNTAKSQKDSKAVLSAAEKKKAEKTKAAPASKKDAKQNKNADPVKSAKGKDQKQAGATSAGKKADESKNKAQTSSKGKNTPPAKAAGSGKDARPDKKATASKATSAPSKDQKQTASGSKKAATAAKPAPAGQKNAGTDKAKSAPKKDAAKAKTTDKKQATNTGAKRAPQADVNKTQKKKS